MRDEDRNPGALAMKWNSDGNQELLKTLMGANQLKTEEVKETDGNIVWKAATDRLESIIQTNIL